MAVFDAVSYTVKMVLYVPMPLGEAGGWSWSSGASIGLEYVFTACELGVALRIWSRMAALTLVRARHDRFAVAALTADSGETVGRDSWLRSAETGRLIPHGEPMVTWDQVVGTAWGVAA